MHLSAKKAILTGFWNSRSLELQCCTSSSMPGAILNFIGLRETLENSILDAKCPQNSKSFKRRYL